MTELRHRRTGAPAGIGSWRHRVAVPGRWAVRAVVGLVLLAAIVVVRAEIAEPMRVSSDSMAPTLRSGDHVLVDKVAARLTGWERGDLVVFHSPQDAALAVKRIVGIGGDRVALRDGVLEVNAGQVDEPYVDLRAVDGVHFGPVTVPAGHVLVMGDNRGDSIDSRVFGAVPRDRIYGRVLLRTWPPR